MVADWTKYFSINQTEILFRDTQKDEEGRIYSYLELVN